MYPFRDRSLSAAERAEDLLSRLTLEEKLGMLNMYNAPVPRLGIPPFHWWNESLHGVARNGTATMFPQSIALAATFTPEFALETGRIIRREAWIKYRHYARHDWYGTYSCLTMFAPNINIFRDPRWGRGHETYGECPELTAQMGSAYIRGIQGDDPEHLQCAATMKHFAVHSGPEALRRGFEAEVSKRDLAQTYLYAFRECLRRSGVKCVMTAYNGVNGTPMSIDPALIRDLLREKWGFDGVTVTDVGTAKYLVTAHERCQDLPEALAREIASGVDVACERADDPMPDLREAVARGLLSEADIDRAVRHQLTLKFQLGIFDEQPLPDYAELECPAHRAVARKIAERSMVLLKNDGILPLDPKRYKSIAVIGPTAQDIEFLRGNYTGDATRYVTLLEGLIETFGEDRIHYARGSELVRDRSDGCSHDPGDRLAEAATVAERADLVILCLGLTANVEGEGCDPSNPDAAGDKVGLELPEPQLKLLETVRRTGKPIVLLSGSGSALVIPEDAVNACLHIFYPGPEGGRIAARILTGEINPSGRLPVTFYRSTADLPDFTDYAMANRTYRYFAGPVQYPFGYGLSYSRFAYEHLSVPASARLDEPVPCSVDVRCEGPVAGETTVLFFFRYDDGPGYAPLRQFAGAVRIALAPGETRHVEFSISPELLLLADEEGEFRPVPGRLTVMVEDRCATVNRA